MSRPADSDARIAYEAWHARLDVDRAADAPWHRLVKRQLHRDRDISGRRVLEIGCGRGGFACWLATLDAPPTFVAAEDFAREAVMKAKAFATEQSIRGVEWNVGDIHAIAHADGEFDTVISCETIEHVESPRQAIRELARVLKPGGRLFLTTPNYFGPMGLYRIYRRLTGRPYTEEGQPINHVVWFGRTCLWVLSAGLRIERVTTAGHYLPVPGRPPVEIPSLDRLDAVLGLFGLHSLVVARKPPRTSL